MNTTSKDKIPVGHYTKNGISQRINIDRGSLRKLITEHSIEIKFKVGKHEYYKLSEVVDALLYGGSRLDLQQERAKLAKRQTEKTKIQIEQMKGDLVPANEVSEAWAALVAAMRARLLSIPTKAAPMVVVIEDQNKAKDIIKKHVNDALAELHTELSAVVNQ